MKRNYFTFKVILIAVTMLIALSNDAISYGLVILSAKEVVYTSNANETNNVLLSGKNEEISFALTSVQKNLNNTLANLSFTTTTPVYAKCPGGLGSIVINAAGGTAPYIYYLIPETQWSAGDLMYNKLLDSNTALLPDYKLSQNTADVAAGTAASPKYYWVAVDDAANSAKFSLRGTNLLSWWKKVAVISTKDPFVITNTANMKLTTTCYQQSDGRISFNITGGTPQANGYEIYLNGKYVKLGFSYDSDTSGLAPGKYEFVIKDSQNCSYSVTYTVGQPKKIVFNFDYSLKSCSQPINELWISMVDASTGSGTIGTWKWRYWSGASAGPWLALTTKVINLYAGHVYDVQIQDGNGCLVFSEKQADLYQKKIIFSMDKVHPVCGKNDGQLWISSVDASTGSGPVNSWKWHYSTDPTFQTNVSALYSITTKATNLPVGTYYVEIEDGIGCSTLANSLVKLESNLPNIIFEAGHKDSNNGPASGELNILSYDEKTGNGSISSWQWHYTTDQTWNTKVSPWYGLWTSVTQLPVGKYYVQVKDAIGCTSAVSQVTIDNISSSAPSVKLAQSDFKVAKLSDNLTLFEFVSPVSTNARIDIYDISGRMVQTIFNNPIEGGITYQAELKMESVIRGIYIYRIAIGSKVHNGKLVL